VTAFVRANVVTHSREPGTRTAWKVLWQMISFDPQWRAHVSNMLRADRYQAECALEAGLTGKSAGRARDYINNVDGALARMKREAGGPLGWAPARLVIAATFVAACGSSPSPAPTQTVTAAPPPAAPLHAPRILQDIDRTLSTM
jgi:hypothetical protein